MPRPDNIVGGDIIVREFSERFVIWRVREDREKTLLSSHEWLGESDNRLRRRLGRKVYTEAIAPSNPDLLNILRPIQPVDAMVSASVTAGVR